MCMCACILMFTCSHGCQKRALDPWKLELKAVVSHPTWVLGTDRGFSKEQRALFPAEPLLQPHK